MPSTYTTNDGLEQPATGAQAGTWGNTLNADLALIDSAIDGVVSVDLTGLSTYTLAITQGAASNGRSKIVLFTGTPSGSVTATVSPNTAKKMYFFKNGTSGGFNVTIAQGSGTTVAITPGLIVAAYCDGGGSGANVASLYSTMQIATPTITGTISGTPTLPAVNARTDGNVTISLAGLSTYTLDSTSLSAGGNCVITFTGQGSTSPVVVTVSPNTTQRLLFVRNRLSLAADFTGSDVQIKQGSGTTSTIPTGTNKTGGIIFCDGTGATANTAPLLLNLFQGGGTTMDLQIPAFFGDAITGTMGFSGLSVKSTGESQVTAGARWIESCPSTGPTDANIANGQYSVWVNESSNLLTFRVRYSSGTYKTGTIALT